MSWRDRALAVADALKAEPRWHKVISAQASRNLKETLAEMTAEIERLHAETMAEIARVERAHDDLIADLQAHAERIDLLRSRGKL